MRILLRSLLLFVLLPCASAHAADHSSSNAEAILHRFYKVSGGGAWKHAAECDSAGTVQIAGKTGSLHYRENLRTGANVAYVDVPGLNLKQANGNDLSQSWQQNESGDIQLTSSADPGSVDDRYITSRAYWRPHFGGAGVTLLPPQTQNGVTTDGVEFHVPGGHGFTLWFNRKTGLLDRITGSDAKSYSDYRRVDEVLLPFAEREPSGNSELLVTYSSKTLHDEIDPKSFAIPFRRDYEMPASGQVTVPAEHGLEFEAKLNGKGPFRTLFDTGSVNLMSASFARRLGLRIDSNAQQFGTASPATLQVHTAHVDTLQIGDLTVRDQTFYVADIPDDSDTPTFAVGYELMRRFAVKIDYKNQRLTFYDGPTFHYAGDGKAVPLYLQDPGNYIYADASVAGVTGRFLLDTGSEIGSDLGAGFVQTNDLVQKLQAHYLGYDGRGYAGPDPAAYLVRVDTFRLGDMPVPGVIEHLATSTPVANGAAGGIGQNILTRFTNVFDVMRGKLYLEKTADSDTPEVFNRAGLIFDTADGKPGLEVMTVLPGSPGDQAGLKIGDQIVAIDGKVPKDEVNQPAFLAPVGSVVRLSVQRGGQSLAMAVTLANVL